MSKTIEQIRKELDAKIPRDAVSQREGGGGKSFSYLQGHYVIARMNEVFGQGNWGYSANEVRCAHTGTIETKYGAQHVAHYIAIVSLYATIGDLNVSFTDVGYGDGSDKVNPGKAHELAAKESVTDAFKRAAKNLGMSMGLALYDKEQTNVEDAEEEKPLPRVAQGTPRNAGPIGVAQSAGKPAEAAPQTTSTEGGGEAPSDRAQLNEMISKMSRVITAKKTKTVAQLKEEMQKRYSTDAKEKLDDAQAKDLYQYLKEIL